MSGQTIYNSHTEQAIRSVLEHPPHGLLLYGDEGAGKLHLAKHIATSLFSNTESNRSSANIHFIQPEHQTISIDQVRRIKELVKLRVPGNQQIRRIIIIQDAHLMREEAQNALLKTLEEPPSDTMFILTALTQTSLAYTVTSRLRAISVRPVTLLAALDTFTEHSEAEVTRSYHLSGGNIGLMKAVIAGDDHPLTAYMDNAKNILSNSVYARLCMVDTLRKNNSDLLNLLYCMKRILAFMVRQETSKKNVQRLKRVVKAESDLRSNVQSRLVLTDLFINL